MEHDSSSSSEEKENSSDEIVYRRWFRSKFREKMI
jgi:hypothetical protein